MNDGDGQRANIQKQWRTSNTNWITTLEISGSNDEITLNVVFKLMSMRWTHSLDNGSLVESKVIWHWLLIAVHSLPNLWEKNVLKTVWICNSIGTDSCTFNRKILKSNEKCVANVTMWFYLKNSMNFNWECNAKFGLNCVDQFKLGNNCIIRNMVR